MTVFSVVIGLAAAGILTIGALIGLVAWLLASSRDGAERAR